MLEGEGKNKVYDVGAVARHIRISERERGTGYGKRQSAAFREREAWAMEFQREAQLKLLTSSWLNLRC